MIQPEEREKINLKIDPVQILEFIDYHSKKIQKEKEYIRAFCPIHKEAHIRTLKIDRSTNQFKCSYRSCPGYEGGDLFELVQLAKDISLNEVINVLVEHIDLDIDPSLLIQSEQEFYDRIEKKIHDKKESEALALIDQLRRSRYYHKLKVKEEAIRLSEALENQEYAEGIFSDLWAEHLAQGKPNTIIRISEKYHNYIRDEEKIDYILETIKSSKNPKKQLNWLKRKARLYKNAKVTKELYYDLLKQVISISPERPDLESALEYFQYIITLEEPDQEEILSISHSLVPILQEEGKEAILQDIQKILLKLGLLSTTQRLKQFKEEYKNNAALALQELERTFKTIYESEEETENVVVFIDKHLAIILNEGNSSLTDICVSILTKNEYFEDQKKRALFCKKFKKVLQKGKFQEVGYIALVKHFIEALNEPGEKISFLLILFKYHLVNQQQAEAKESAAQIFDTGNSSSEEGKAIKVWEKLLVELTEPYDLFWMYEQALLYFSESKRPELIEKLFAKMKEQPEYHGIQHKIEEDLLIQAEKPELQQCIQYLKAFNEEGAPPINTSCLVQILQKIPDFWQIPELRAALTALPVPSIPEPLDFIEDILTCIRTYPIEEEYYTWLEYYLDLADPNDSPMYFVEYTSQYFENHYQEKFLLKAIEAFGHLTDQSYYKTIIEKACSYLTKLQDMTSLQNLWESFFYHYALEDQTYAGLLDLTMEKENQPLFIKIHQHLIDSHSKPEELLTEKYIQYAAKLLQIDEIKPFLEKLLEQEQSALASQYTEALFQPDNANPESKKDLFDAIPKTLLTNEIEEQYTQNLFGSSNIGELVEFYQAKSAICIEQHQLEEALQYCNKIMELSPDDLPTIHQIAEIEEKIGKMENAIQYYRRIYEIYINDQLYNDAIVVLDKIIELSPTDKNALEQLVELKEQQNCHDNLTDNCFQLGQLYETQKENEQALYFFQKAWDHSNKDHLNAIKKIFKAAYIKGDKEQLKEILNDIIPLLEKEEDLISIQKFYALTEKICTNDIELLQEYGNYLLKNNKVKEGLKRLRRAGEISIKEKRFTDTINIYEQIVAVNPATITFHSRLGKLYSKLSQNNESVSHYLEAAKLCHQKNRPEDAIQMLKIALQENPFDFEAAEYLTKLYVETDRSNKAYPLLLSIGENLEMNENAEKACQYYKQAYKIHHPSITLCYKLTLLSDQYEPEAVDLYLEKWFELIVEKQDISTIENYCDYMRSHRSLQLEKWEQFFIILIAQEKKEQARTLLEELIHQTTKEKSFTEQIRLSKLYLQHYEPGEVFTLGYLLAAYRSAPTEFEKEWTLFKEQYPPEKVFTGCYQDVFTQLIEEAPLDLYLHDQYIQLLTITGETEDIPAHIITIYQLFEQEEANQLFEEYEPHYLKKIETDPKYLRIALPYYANHQNDKFTQLSKQCADLYYKNGDILEALETLSQALEKAPEEIAFREKKLEIYLAAQDEMSVFDEAEQIACYYEDREEWDKTIEVLKKLGSNTNTQMRIIQLYLKQKQIPQAMTTLYEYAETAMKQENDIKKALLFLEQGNQINPGNIQTHKRIIEVLEQSNNNPEQLANEYACLAELYMKSGALSGAEKNFRQATETAPDLPGIWEKYFEFLENSMPAAFSLEVFQDYIDYQEGCSEQKQIPSFMTLFASLTQNKQFEYCKTLTAELPDELLQVLISDKDANEEMNLLSFLTDSPVSMGTLSIFQYLYERWHTRKTLPKEFQPRLEKLLDQCVQNNLLEESLKVYDLLILTDSGNLSYYQEYLSLAVQCGLPSDKCIDYELCEAELFIAQGLLEKGYDIIAKMCGQYPDRMNLLEKKTEYHPMIGFEQEIVEDYRALAKYYGKEQNQAKEDFYWTRLQMLIPEDPEVIEYFS